MTRKKVTARLLNTSMGWEISCEGFRCTKSLKRMAVEEWGRWAAMVYTMPIKERTEIAQNTKAIIRIPVTSPGDTSRSAPAVKQSSLCDEGALIASQNAVNELKRITFVRHAAKALDFYKAFKAYIEEVRKRQRLSPEQLRPGQTLDEWIQWAERYATTLHPFSSEYRPGRV